jgi:hypothetical protein
MDMMIFGLVILLAFFGGIGFLVWLDHKGKLRQREMEQAERIKSMELGQELPDIALAWAKADLAQTRAAAAIGILVPLILVGAMVGLTVLVLHWTEPRYQMPLLIILWGIGGVVSLVTALVSLSALRRSDHTESEGEAEESDEEGEEESGEEESDEEWEESDEEESDEEAEPAHEILSVKELLEYLREKDWNVEPETLKTLLPYLQQMHERELIHAERMKAIEYGQSLSQAAPGKDPMETAFTRAPNDGGNAAGKGWAP